MAEKRKLKRAKKYFAINIVAVNLRGQPVRFDSYKANPKFCDESGIDFSPEGVQIMCSKLLPKETKIQLKMLIPDKEGLNLIRANGSIKWFRQVKGKYKKYFIIGVHFREIQESEKDKLTSLWKKYSSAGR